MPKFNMTLTKEAAEKFEGLPEGDYRFTIQSVDWDTAEATDKAPACNVLVLKLACENGVRSGFIFDRIKAVNTTLWKFCQLFEAVGMWDREMTPEFSPTDEDFDELLNKEGVLKIKKEASKKTGKKYSNVNKYYKAGTVEIPDSEEDDDSFEL